MSYTHLLFDHFMSIEGKVYFATKHGTLRKRNPLLYPQSHTLSPCQEKEQAIASQNFHNGPLIQIVIPRSLKPSKEPPLPSINHKKTQFGKHNSFNLRLWS
jgi:hypothetical protein